MRKLSITTIKNFFKKIEIYGVNSVSSNLDGSFANPEITVEPIDTFPVLDEKSRTIEDYEKIVFNRYSDIEVSIVIPVYNQFGYTYNCLKSVRQNSGDIHYEIIVANDCSTDLTKQLSLITENVTIIDNATNLKFLQNCNNAAKFAKGKYILFLNNDTQVQKDWLSPLVQLIESDETIGLVGSKFVYPNGKLQEAGGIIWSDGSAWNYGHNSNPEFPEYNYVKDVDYISGASIMIRKSLWKTIGGFDERYIPSYYEDADLAFEVRKHGYKVVFQPKSAVVHFEGISNGKSVEFGIKQYQTVNAQKFLNKWHAELTERHFVNSQNLYLAKDRGQFKKHILVIDHYVPNFDKDAGGKTTFMYLQMFVKMGLKVTFIGDNFARMQPYTDILNQMGIEVLYGNDYFMNYKEWLKKNLKYFDYVYLQRPHISIKYIDIVKEYFKGKTIFYYAHDLHHIRLQRSYELTGNHEDLKESIKMKKIEMELFSKADVGHVVGNYEQKVMQKAFPNKPIRNIPIFIYDKEPKDIEKDFSKRKDLLFVGGFNHYPNLDGVLWFAENVFPQLLKTYPDIIWHIVGSNTPERIQKLACKNIVIEGFLSDEKLENLYRSCRIAVAPLRVGAGIKGKVIEAAYYQIPMVTTSIGGEGIDDSIGAFVMAGTAENMINLLTNLYEDYKTLQKMSDNGKKLVKKYYSPEVAYQTIIKDM